MTDPVEHPSATARLIRFSLRNKLVVSLLLVFLASWGVLVAPFDWKIEGLPRDPVPVDAIPDTGENQQIVFTEWTGRSPQDVEDQVTYPLTAALLGVPGVRSIRSSSMFGFSSIFVIFDDSVEFYWSRSRLLEKLNSLPAGTLPEGAHPALGPDATPLGQVYWYTLEGFGPDGSPTGGWDLHELRTIQDWQVRYALSSVEGVAEVASIGGHVQEYQIDVDPDAMRAHGISLDSVFSAVRNSNVDVGARSIEINRVEYVIRGLGLLRSLEDLENTVVGVSNNVPITIRQIAKVGLGPAPRRGVLDKGGAEAVGGVVVVRYGANPMAVIQRVKEKIAQIAPGMPRKTLADGTVSQVRVVPFYDRTGLIQETLGTLSDALRDEILVTIIVVLVMLTNLRSAILISGLLPLAVLICFIAMKQFGVDANVVALSGIVIAIGTMVDLGIVISENILKHIRTGDSPRDRFEAVYRGAAEVGGAVLTAVLTTVVSFLPVFTMEGAEGKLFKPLAYTKTFALLASVAVALVIIPPLAHLLLADGQPGRQRRLRHALLLVAGLVLTFGVGWWAGAIVFALLGWQLLRPLLPARGAALVPRLANFALAAAGTVLLARTWQPLGPTATADNLLFAALLIGGLLALFYLFHRAYVPILRFCLANKALFLAFPAALVLLGTLIWLGYDRVLGFTDPWRTTWFGRDAQWTDLPPAQAYSWHAVTWLVLAGTAIVALGIGPLLSRTVYRRRLQDGGPRPWALASWVPPVALLLLFPLTCNTLTRLGEDRPRKDLAHLAYQIRHEFPGLGKEFMPPLDEGSYLLMPIAMYHASISEALDLLQKQDMMIRAIPEVQDVVGKIGRVDSALDPAPVAMVETVVTYKSEYVTDANGHPLRFAYDPAAGTYRRDAAGELVPDPDGHPFRQWRPEIRRPRDIWNAIAKAAEILGMTTASELQPMETRRIMLQTGLRAPFGVKVSGPDLATIERVGLEIERILKQVPSVNPDTVFADRVVGKPYLEIDIDRQAIARYGLTIRQIQDVIEVAIGGKFLTTTVEGRARFPVRVRYLRELRDQIESITRILVAARDGTQIPLGQVAKVRYTPGPQNIKSEDTFLVSYVIFNQRPGHAEVDVVEECQRTLAEHIRSGDLVLPGGVSYRFAGNYENQVRAMEKLRVVLPVALFSIFLILFLQFRSVSTTLIVFSGVFVAWSGGFLMVWLYGRDWFLDFAVFGTDMRDLFQVHTINLSVAVWVGFLALFGIATDDGVIMSTYLAQTFDRDRPATQEAVRQAVVEAGIRRIRPCLMTTATTLLALLPVLSSAGRGSDIMVPMAIPSFGGMAVVLLSVFVVPTLYCLVQEWRLRLADRAT